MNAIVMGAPPPAGSFVNNTIQCDGCGKSATYGVEAKWIKT